MYVTQTKCLPVTERLVNEVDGMQNREYFLAGVGLHSHSWLRVQLGPMYEKAVNCYRGICLNRLGNTVKF
jgi:hypothetical protein